MVRVDALFYLRQFSYSVLYSQERPENKLIHMSPFLIDMALRVKESELKNLDDSQLYLLYVVVIVV